MHRALAAGFAALILFSMTTPRSVAASDEVRTSASSVYRVEPDKGRISVEVAMKVTNAVPSTTTSYDCSYQYYDYYFGFITIPRTCSSTTRYFINETYLWVESNAKGLKVTSNGGSVKLANDSKIQGYRSYKVTFPKIFNGQTRTITAKYTIPGGVPRSATTHRVNGAYVNFSATSQATDAAKVTVKIPKAFDVETYGAKMTTKVSGPDRVLSSGAIEDPSSFYVGISGNNAAGFVHDQITTGEGRTISILGWPGDKAWMDAVRGEASTAIPSLESIIGQPLPGEGDIVIRETAGSVLGDAYVGVYDSEMQLARVSEDFDQTGTVTHELSHAWFNDSLFAARWLSEGYASWIERGTGTVTSPCVTPAAYPGDGKPSLASWQVAGPRATAKELGVVSYQYDAACALVSQVASRIGVRGMRDVIGALATPESAYAGVSDLKPGAPVGWRDWLDAIDERGMGPAKLGDATDIASLLVDFGIATPADLSKRAEARTALTALRDSTADWPVPLAVARPMAFWDFPEAEAAIKTASETFRLIAQVESLLPSVEASTNPVRQLYSEAAVPRSLESAREQASRQVEAATAVADAVALAAVVPGPIEQVGMLGTDVHAMVASAVEAVKGFKLDDARSDAEQVQHLLADAATTGLMRIGVVSVVLIILIVLAFWVVRRHRRSATLAAPLPIVEDVVDTPIASGVSQAPLGDNGPAARGAYVSGFAALPTDTGEPSYRPRPRSGD